MCLFFRKRHNDYIKIILLRCAVHVVRIWVQVRAEKHIGNCMYMYRCRKEQGNKLKFTVKTVSKKDQVRTYLYSLWFVR